MLRRVDFAATNPDSPAPARVALPTGIDLYKTIAFIKASKRILVCWAVLGVVLALVFAWTAVPEYTAAANLLMDAPKSPVFKNDTIVNDNLALDASHVESQAEIIRSNAIARAVVDKLRLADDPEFTGGPPNFAASLVRTVFGLGDVQKVKSPEERQRLAALYVQDHLNVRRVGVTYVLEIAYRSTNPDKAARIANAVADAYLVNQLETKYEATKRASVWLQERLDGLRNQSAEAEKAVQEFKAQNNIVDTGNHTLLSDHQLQELNSQLVIATANTAEMRAKVERVESVLKSPEPNQALGTGTVADALANTVILHLRQQYLDARQREADISSRFGANHVSAINLRNDMLELQKSMVLELRRIADSYRSDYEIAKTREESIRASVQELVKQADSGGAAQVNLKELESSAATYRTMFENFLQRYTEAVQQQSFPISDAQVISRADPPLGKSFPKTTLLAVLGILVGGGCGFAHSIVVRNLDRTIRTPVEFEEKLGLDCLSLIPIIAELPVRVEPSPQPKIERRRKKKRDLASGNQPNLGLLQRNMSANSVMRLSVTAPLSRFVESLRSVKTSIDITALARPIKVIGMLSAVPNEGKSTVAANLASIFANSGQRTLLIDGDLRNPRISSDLAPGATGGLIELIQGRASAEDVWWTDPETGLKLIPAVVTHRVNNSGDVMGSERLKSILSGLAAQFDYIIIDLPPIGAVVDARAISPQIDGFIMVVEWGKTRVDVLDEALLSLGTVGDKIIGGVLNKVDYRMLNNIDGYSPGYYVNELYRRYGYSDA
jgi:succinoglycan biosynthesis transport protein ExoP